MSIHVNSKKEDHLSLLGGIIITPLMPGLNYANDVNVGLLILSTNFTKAFLV